MSKTANEHCVLTGCAGFIGSHILVELLTNGWQVIGLDNLSNGFAANLAAVEQEVGPERWANFRFIEGDIREPATCLEACKDAQVICHQAAIGSVPRSLREPALYQQVNDAGFVNILEAARLSGIRRVVYASSSSVYGDSTTLPKVEAEIGNPLSPYAASKRINEIHAALYARCYEMECVGLRYFNVFGPRQNPNGAYAAVIPRWIQGIREGESPLIFGDGETSRDFCFVANAVQANVKSLTAETIQPGSAHVFNIACGESTSLNALYQQIAESVQAQFPEISPPTPTYQDFRQGDIRHSLASIASAMETIGYQPEVFIGEGLQRTVQHFLATPVFAS